MAKDKEQKPKEEPLTEEEKLWGKFYLTLHQEVQKLKEYLEKTKNKDTDSTQK